MTSTTVEAVRLTKHYGGRSAVEDVSFSASQGEIVGLLGRNGAGKTTTIRLLTTVLEPTAANSRLLVTRPHRRRKSGDLSACFRRAAATQVFKLVRVPSLLRAPLRFEPQSSTQSER